MTLRGCHRSRLERTTTRNCACNLSKAIDVDTAAHPACTCCCNVVCGRLDRSPQPCKIVSKWSKQPAMRIGLHGFWQGKRAWHSADPCARTPLTLCLPWHACRPGVVFGGVCTTSWGDSQLLWRCLVQKNPLPVHRTCTHAVPTAQPCHQPPHTACMRATIQRAPHHN